jgi:MoaA/NifB/PqqE/SkfB family radical SAM enzyme
LSAAERLVVVLRLTEACNLSCGFCAYDRRLQRSRVSADASAVRELGRALVAEGRRRDRPVLLSFLGGEPLLWPGLAALEVELLALGLELSVTTNGTTLGSAAVRERLLTRYREVTISVDGLPATHDRLRGWPGGFEELERGLRWLIEARRERGRGPLVRVNTVLMADNLGEYAALCRRLADFGVDELTFNQLGGRDRPEFHALQRLTPAHVAELESLLPELRAELGARGVELRGGQAYLERFAKSARGQRLPVADCRPGSSFLFASEQGSLAPCSFTVAELGVPASALAEHDFSAARSARRPSVCDDCPSTQVFSKFAE